MAKIDLTSFEWCELIFKGKNKLTVPIKCVPIHPSVTTWQWSLC